MAAINLKSLVGKLNPISRRAMEAAAGMCLSRTNYNIEIEHWLIKLLEPADSDLTRILKHYDVDTSRANRELTKSLDGLKTGNARPPELSPEVVDLMRESWVMASLKYGSPMVRTGHILAALLNDRNLSGRLKSSSAELAKIPAEQLERDLPGLTSGTAEEADLARSQPAGAATSSDGRPVSADSKTPSLDQFTTNLTDLARRKKIDPVLGRDTEVRQIIDILTRRRQNNPILTGEAGVGKTAVVEGFALKIVAGDVPDALKNVTLRTLDLGLLQAGAGMKGEFENRLRSVIDEVKASPTPIVIFIDEAHTMIGAGGAAGQGDAANLLKPALARGELRTIAATTWAEYKKYFEKDAALTRRFQVVKIEEPSEPAAVEMMRGLIDTLEKHHGVRILNEAVVEAVRLSNRYISGRQLPDKSVSLLDTACARVAMSHAATPPAIEDLRRRYEQLGVSIEVLERENVTGGKHDEQVTKQTAERAEVKEQLAALEKRWEKEKELVSQIRAIRDRLEGRPLVAKTEPGKQAPAPAASATAAKPSAATTPEKPAAATTPLTPAEREKLRDDLDKLNAQLHEVQGETPLLQVCVDGQAVADVVAAWTGIPVGRMVSNEIQTVLNLKQKMEERIIGQSHALEAIAQSIRTSRAGLTDPRRPVGVFMLVGPSGTGKTETAITLAELLFGGVQNMTVINMSEFKEEHKVSLLMGSPPGYVGYGEGGVLTEAVRRRPYSVVLLDELEKSHPGVQEIFYQVFDKGQLRDGEGRDIDFKNTVILMTSNAATDTVMKLCADPETMPDAEGLAEALRPELLKVFKPAFLGRISIIPYFPLSDEALRNIIELKLRQVQRRVEDNYHAQFDYSPDVVTMIAGRCKEVESGVRNIDHIISRTLLPELSSEFLSRMAEGRSIASVHIGVDKSGNFSYEIK